ncbi:MAG: ABC transporter permease [Synergistaceae bacterium]|nr:ABC transporter permease [Synergistaceae bacterium]
MFETFKTAMLSLLANKSRSMLTMLGVLIGVAAVITMIAVGTGASRQMESIMSGIGSNVIMLMPGSNRQGGIQLGSGSGRQITYADAMAIKNECPSVLEVSPMVSSFTQVVLGNQNWATQTQGVTTGAFSVNVWNIAEGSFFSEADVRGATKVCLLGSTVATNLMGEGNEAGAIGQSIRINKVPFEVVGVLAPKGAQFGNDQDDVVMVPITTAMRRLVRSQIADQVRNVSIQVINADSVTAAMNEVTALMRQRRGTAEGRDDEFTIRNLAQMIESARQSSQVMALLLGAVASVSLLVGGIGIMNIMLVSVTERTREIGIRMAIGARRGDIRFQFLLEAMILSLLGGAIGILSGFGISQAITKFLGWQTEVSIYSIIISAGFSGIVGIFFGFYPAWKASLLRPIDALRAD